MSLPPGPRLPALAQTLWYAARPTEFLEQMGRTYGDAFTFRSVLFGTEVCFSRPEVLKEIFTGDPDTLQAGAANQVLSRVVGATSVLLLDGAAHMRQRRLMLPSFHGERMAAYTTIMIEAARRVQARWKDHGQRRVSLRPDAQRITLEIILRAVFGAEGRELGDLGAALRSLLDIGSSPAGTLVNLLPGTRSDAARRTLLSGFYRARDAADACIYAQIARRRAAGPERQTDVLSLLLQARDEQGQPMTDLEIRDELVTLLVAGHETTATTLCWVLEELLGQREARAAVLAELREVTGGRPLEASGVPRLRVLEAAIREAMRLHPVIPAVGRKLSAPTRIGGYDLPAGVVAVPVIHLTHRLPDLYPDPNVFRVDRFLDKKVDPYAWLPFGGGVRRCLGMAFAMHELKVVTAVLLEDPALRLARPAKRTVLRGITHAPSGGTQVAVA